MGGPAPPATAISTRPRRSPSRTHMGPVWSTQAPQSQTSHGAYKRKRDITLDIAAIPSYSAAALPRGTYRFLLRMPEELRRRLTAAADRSGRSLNGELVHRLDKSLRPSPARTAADKAAGLTEIVKGGRRGQVLRPKHRVVIGAVAIPAALLIALLLAFAGGSGGTATGKAAPLAKGASGGDPDAAASNSGLGPVSFDAYQAAERTYPANVIPPAIAQRAEDTFNAIAAADAEKGDPKGAGHNWKLY